GDAPPDIFAVADDGGDHPEDTRATESDEDQHRRIGEAFQAIIRAAFVCDLTRIATFQWSPGTNHVAFKGRHPDNPDGVFTHHPVSHLVGDTQILEPNPAKRNGDVQFLVNIEKWYNERTTDLVTKLASTNDAFGNPLLDHTIVPYISEV